MRYHTAVPDMVFNKRQKWQGRPRRRQVEREEEE